MIRLIPKYILQFISLVLFQVVILNSVQINGYINPYLYIVLIITLPFELAGWITLLLGFALGLSIDMFSNTAGVHASATLFMAFLREVLLPFLSPREGYESGTFPTVKYYGWMWFAKYAGLLVLGHHLFLFFIEAFSFNYLGHTFLKVISSSIITFILILLTQSKQSKTS